MKSKQLFNFKHGFLLLLCLAIVLLCCAFALIQKFAPRHSWIFFKAQHKMESAQELRELFKNGMSRNEIAIYVKMMKSFDSACDKFNLTYMIIWGTLLGSYRHHGFIPWDDDVDLIVNKTRRDDLHQVVEIMGKEYILDSSSDERWKIYHKRDSWPTNRNWRWPFVDISFFTTSRTHIYDSATSAFTRKLEDIFPLKRRYFQGEYFWAPKTFEEALGSAAFMEECCTRNWSHRKEHEINEECRPCKLINLFHPFVFRRDLGNGSIAEHLFQGVELIQTLVTN